MIESDWKNQLGFLFFLIQGKEIYKLTSTSFPCKEKKSTTIIFFIIFQLLKIWKITTTNKLHKRIICIFKIERVDLQPTLVSFHPIWVDIV